MRIIFTLIMTFVFAACAPFQTIDTTDCEDAKQRQATVKYLKNSNIGVTPPNLEVTQGDAVIYKVIGDRSRKVNMVGSGDSSWLSVEIAEDTGSGNIRFGYVCVDKEQEPVDSPYKYKVVIEGIGELDPEVTVRRRTR